MDEEYVLFSTERQKFQDKIIYDYIKTIEKVTPLAEPEVIFTAGAMGVGKGFATESYQKCGGYDPSKYLVIDPDKIKPLLPEFKEQIELRKNLSKEIQAGAAGYVHEESSYIGKVIREIGIAKKVNIVIDGSLKSGTKNLALMKRMKSLGYRISIIYVSAPLETIKKRVAQRAAETGRDIPLDEVTDNFNKVDNSVNMLERNSELSKTFIEINNSSIPNIVKFVKNNNFISNKKNIPLVLPGCKQKILELRSN